MNSLRVRPDRFLTTIKVQLVFQGHGANHWTETLRLLRCVLRDLP